MRQFINNLTLVIILPIVLSLSYLPVYQTYKPLLNQVHAQEIESYQYQIDIQKIKQLQGKRLVLQTQITQVDKSLLGISTFQVQFWNDKFSEDLAKRNFLSARESLIKLDQAVSLVLLKQDELRKKEKERLIVSIQTDIKEGRGILANMDEIQLNLRGLVNSTELNGKERLEALRSLAARAAETIKQRRAVNQTAVKQIVVKKSELKLYMYENGEKVYEMPVSLGRAGYGTRSGDFTVLDKMGTVWGVWQIYLPYWLGIYYAGGSENGIHGIPYDKAGHRYWTQDIGAKNVTYGCVMSDDKDSQTLYNWVEVGVPVTIIN